MNEIALFAHAAWITFELAFFALMLGFVLTIIFVLWESIRWRPFAWIGSLLVTILRGLPEILLVLFIYFGSSQLLFILSNGFNVSLGSTKISVQIQIKNFDVSPFLCGVLALSLLYSAYASQTLRGALNSIPEVNGNLPRFSD